MAVGNRCPVCQARFRGERNCSRCGADLTAIMTLAARSWALRESARHAIADGEFERAAEYAAEAQRLQVTPAGEALLLLSELMKTGTAVTETEIPQVLYREPSLAVHLL